MTHLRINLTTISVNLDQDWKPVMGINYSKSSLTTITFSITL